ncbi:unnamed protein product, partial [Urochloa humidicola]
NGAPTARRLSFYSSICPLHLSISSLLSSSPLFLLPNLISSSDRGRWGAAAPAHGPPVRSYRRAGVEPRDGGGAEPPARGRAWGHEAAAAQSLRHAGARGAGPPGAWAWGHAAAAARSLRHAGARGATRRRWRRASGTRAQGRGARRRRAAAASRFGEEIKRQEEDYVMQGRRHEIEREF